MRARTMAFLGLIVMMLGLMTVPASADEIGDLSNHVTTYEIHADGSMTTKSTVTWRFTTNVDRVYFSVPVGVAGRNDLSCVRIVGPDGKQPKTHLTYEAGHQGQRLRRYTVEAKDYPIKSGPWRLEYTLAHALTEHQPWTVFSRRHLSPDNPLIKHWEATVSTPWEIDQVNCTVNGKKICRTEQNGKSVTFSGRQAPRGTDVVIQAGVLTALTGHIGEPERPNDSSSTVTPSYSPEASDTPLASAEPSESTAEPSPSERESNSIEASPSVSKTPAAGSSTKDSDDDQSSFDVAKFVGFVVGVLALIGVVVVIVWLILRRRRNDAAAQKRAQQYPQQYPQQAQQRTHPQYPQQPWQGGPQQPPQYPPQQPQQPQQYPQQPWQGGPQQPPQDH
ncbi:DUF2207 domain-containing protein [Cutibacterium equinum]|uniref:DUF2207 domain-containing protein n=1 Tax=Cutibacterium equinum TaxID=3016342 RepID=A0ABY7QXT2_9ACTN|nr:DUF2207 domain-containing protein [Cutibacterium equinum]WCC79332.1 DUF2207 domain-containing protein [Cutibacterium equinum]